MDRIYKDGSKTAKKEIIRLKLFLIIANFIIILVLLANFILFLNKEKNCVFAESVCVNAQAHVVVDADTLTVFHGENMHQRLPMASTTKIMTAILAIENLDLNKCININSNAIGVEGSSIYLSHDKQYKIRDLVYGLMLRSGNDAAEALAYEISGSIEEFAKLMNKKAKSLNLENTNFVNPHGLHDKNHYTSAYDLAVIASYALKNPTFLEIVSSKLHIIESDEGVYYNKNKLLSQYDGANGVKTGYTTVSGKCLVSSAKRYGRQVVGVVLNCPDTWECSKRLLDFAFSKYDILTLCKAKDVIVNELGIKLYLDEDLNVALDKNKNSNITFKARILDNLDKNIQPKGQVGYLDVYVNNCLLFSKKLYTIDTIIINKDKNKLNSLLFEFNNGENQ